LTIIARAMLLVAFLVAAPASAQQSTRLRLFLDCHTRCDGSFLRTELTLVDWVTDRTASDVHVIATSLGTGAGGSEVTLEFLGRNALAGLSDRHTLRTSPDATDDDRRREFLRVLRLGLARYLLAANQAGALLLTEAERDDDDSPATSSGADPWKNWVFEVEANGSLDGESRETNYEVGAQVGASRTTADWKIRFDIGMELDRSTFELDDGEKFTAKRDGWDSELLVVRSLGPHWSVGGLLENRSSRTSNLEYRARLAPAIEWNYFPYDEATRRQFVVLYTVGYNRYQYVEETIFGHTEETRFDHRLQVGYESRQPWGSAHLSGNASAFLHDWALNRLGVDGGISVRLARGLELDINGGYSRVRNQITLRKGDASDEEIFLRLRELATGYRARLEMGLSYTFGSFLNTVVNPRFDDID
jgi:hypothetical protein